MDGTIRRRFFGPLIELENGKRRVSLAKAPLDVGPTLRDELFQKVPSAF